MNILCIGDIVGRPGRNFLKQNLKAIMKEHQIDFVIANGENSAGGIGITKDIYDELLEMGIGAITMGNHTWSKKEIFNFIDQTDCLIRPANYPEATAGKGYITFNKNNKKITVINICGRVYMECLECPFKTMDHILKEIAKTSDIIIVDFHAEATSEKQALGWYLDGKITALFGTHTHVQTSDEKILPLGTGYITDLGMTGPVDSILGVNKEIIINKFISMLPGRFEVASGRAIFGAIVLKIDDESNKTTEINRLNITE